MLEQLSPEQAYELCCYHGIEPFGEVRKDLRMARLLQFYYDAKRGKKGNQMSVEQFVLYGDIAESASEPASEAALLRALGG